MAGCGCCCCFSWRQVQSFLGAASKNSSLPAFLPAFVATLEFSHPGNGCPQGTAGFEFGTTLDTWHSLKPREESNRNTETNLPPCKGVKLAAPDFTERILGIPKITTNVIRTTVPVYVLVTHHGLFPHGRFQQMLILITSETFCVFQDIALVLQSW